MTALVPDVFSRIFVYGRILKDRDRVSLWGRGQICFLDRIMKIMSLWDKVWVGLLMLPAVPIQGSKGDPAGPAKRVLGFAQDRNQMQANRKWEQSSLKI